MPIFWNKNYFFIIVLQSYDVILNLNAKRCTKLPKKLLLMNLLADFCHYKLYRYMQVRDLCVTIFYFTRINKKILNTISCGLKLIFLHRSTVSVTAERFISVVHNRRWYKNSFVFGKDMVHKYFWSSVILA